MSSKRDRVGRLMTFSGEVIPFMTEKQKKIYEFCKKRLTNINNEGKVS